MKIDVLAQLATLLHQNEEVNVPGIGIISTRQNDFSIDRRQGLIVPASKQVHTLTQITDTNNEDLVNFIAHKYGISLEEARQAVNDFVRKHQDSIRHKGLSIPNLGRVVMNEEGLIAFEPNVVHNFDPEYFGLPVLKNVHPIALPKPKKEEKTIVVTTAIPADKITPVAPKPTQLPAKKNRVNQIIKVVNENKIVQVGFPVLLLLVIAIFLSKNYYNKSNAGYSFNITTKNQIEKEGDIPTVKDVTDENTDKPVVIPPPKTRKPIKRRHSEGKSVVVDEPTPKPVTPQPVTPKPRNTDQDKPSTPDVAGEERHLIVVGVYSNKANAEKMQVGVFANGYEADITEKYGGKYQVGIILKCSRNALRGKMKQVKKKYPSAWWKNSK